MSYKILTKFIKDISFEIPTAQAFTMLQKEISKYNLNFDIKSHPFKENIIEVNTILRLTPSIDVKNKMLTEINTLDQKVDNEYKIALGNAREGMGVDKEKVRYDVIISTLKNISSIAKSTETSTHHKILSKTLQKDGPNVKAFYNNVKAMRSEDGFLNIAIATELMSPFLDSKIGPNQLRLPGLKI